MVVFFVFNKKRHEQIKIKFKISFHRFASYVSNESYETDQFTYVHSIRRNRISDVTVGFFATTFTFVYCNPYEVMHTSRKRQKIIGITDEPTRAVDPLSGLTLITYCTNNSKILFIRYVRVGPVGAYL